MTKGELINKVHATTNNGTNKKDVAAIIDSTFAEIRKSVKKEKRFSLPLFGTFTVRRRKARNGKNPHTGENIKIPASKTVGFKPAPVFKQAL